MLVEFEFLFVGLFVLQPSSSFPPCLAQTVPTLTGSAILILEDVEGFQNGGLKWRKLYYRVWHAIDSVSLKQNNT